MSIPSSGAAVSLGSLRHFCTDAFRATGMSATDADRGADVLVTTDAWGVFTHGTKALRGYLRRLLAGGLKPAGRPRIVSEGPAWALVDGDSALGMVTSHFAMEVAIGKARTAGIGFVGVRNSCHFGAAGYYAAQAAEAGLIGLSMANDVPSVAAPGSLGAVTGSNPLAYAVPAGRHPPLMLDMSTAIVAGGKVVAARERGEPIPAGWLIGADGRPTDDAASYPATSTLAPAAAHKGYGLALLIETLSGALAGAAMTFRVGSWQGGDFDLPTHHGAAFLAIDCLTIGGDQFPERVARLIDEIHSAPATDDMGRLRVPGEFEWEGFKFARTNGVVLPPDVFVSLQEAADLVNLTLDSYLS